MLYLHLNNKGQRAKGIILGQKINKINKEYYTQNDSDTTVFNPWEVSAGIVTYSPNNLHQ